MEKARILVVEDEGLTALAIKHSLTGAGYEVAHLATTGEEAIKASAEMGPDLVLMDIRLEGKLDGIEAAGRIRESLHIPIVYLTAYSDESTLSRARVTEPFGYLLKPFEEQSLLAAVEMSLYKGEMENRLRRTKAKLEAILRCVSDGIVLADMKGTIDYLNPAAQRLLGIGEEHPASLSVFRVLNLLDRPSREALVIPFEQVVLQGEAISLQDCALLTEDGRSISVELDLAPYWDEGGTGRGVVFAIRDVSQRHTLEDLSDTES